MSDSTIDAKPRLTKQGVRDLNPRGPRQEKLGPLGPGGESPGPAKASLPAASAERPDEAPPVVS
jgi:hypothetical protein